MADQDDSGEQSGKPQGRSIVLLSEPGITEFRIEMPTDYADGYRVTVGWSAEDDAWIARLSGVSTGSVIGDGKTKEEALLCLCCALACTIDAVNPDYPTLSPSPSSPSER